jgi:hypothetical protein
MPQLVSCKALLTISNLQRNLRDLALNARIDWTVPWDQVPAKDKAMLYDVVRVLN